MNEESPNTWIDPELEARIVALVLGESSDFERDELARLIEERAELAVLQDQIKSVHGLLQEVATSEFADDDADWKLSADKRRRVLAVIDGESEDPTAKPIVQTSIEKPSSVKANHFWTFNRVAAVLCVAGMIGAVAILPWFGSRLLDRVGGSRLAFQKANALVEAAEFTADEAATPSRLLMEDTAETIATTGELPQTSAAGGGGYGGEGFFEEDSQSALSSIRDSLSVESQLPSPYYLYDDVQYFPATPENAMQQGQAGSRYSDGEEMLGQSTGDVIRQEQRQPASDSVNIQGLAQLDGDLDWSIEPGTTAPTDAGTTPPTEAGDALSYPLLAMGGGNQTKTYEWTDLDESKSSVPDGGTVLLGGIKRFAYPGIEREAEGEPSASPTVPPRDFDASAFDRESRDAISEGVTALGLRDLAEFESESLDFAKKRSAGRESGSSSKPQSQPAQELLAGGYGGGSLETPSMPELPREFSDLRSAFEAREQGFVDDLREVEEFAAPSPSSVQMEANLAEFGTVTGQSFSRTLPSQPAEKSKGIQDSPVDGENLSRNAQTDGLFNFYGTREIEPSLEDAEQGAASFQLDTSSVSEWQALPSQTASASKGNEIASKDHNFQARPNISGAEPQFPIPNPASRPASQQQAGGPAEGRKSDAIAKAGSIPTIRGQLAENLSELQGELKMGKAAIAGKRLDVKEGRLAPNDDRTAHDYSRSLGEDGYGGGGMGGGMIDDALDRRLDTESFGRPAAGQPLSGTQLGAARQDAERGFQNRGKESLGKISAMNQNLQVPLQVKEKVYLDKFGEGHPSVAMIRKEIELLNRQRDLEPKMQRAVESNRERAIGDLQARAGATITSPEDRFSSALEGQKLSKNLEVDAELPPDGSEQNLERMPEIRQKKKSNERSEAVPQDELLALADQNQWHSTEPHLLADNSSSLRKWARRTAPIPAGLNEKTAEDEAFSTFSLHVSDVSFKLAQAALSRGEWPEPAKIRIEEFVNAVDYGDPMPSRSERVACRVEQSIHPFLQQRNLLRVSMRTAAAGRSSKTPLRLTLLLDNSGSMERPDRQQTVRRAFALLAQQLKPIDQVTLISFARTPRLLADKVSGDQSPQLVQLVQNLPSEGGTNIEAALQLAIEKAQEQLVSQAQNRVIMLTDGAVNLGDANPDGLSRMITTMRNAGIAFDAAGICAEGLNDEVLEALTRKGDGRYYLLDSHEAAEDGFARQIAGALRPSAKNVKLQIEFNPRRVGRYKLLGFEKHRLKQEDFRNDAVDAAEMAAAEAGVALYQFEAKPEGDGDVGAVSVRFRDLSTGQMIENRWPIPYEAEPPRIDQAPVTIRIAASAALLAAKLRGAPLGESVDLKTLSNLMAGLPDGVSTAQRVQQLRQMVQQARQLSGE